MATNIQLTEEERKMNFYPRVDELNGFFDFHPTSTPRGMQHCDKNFYLNASQQNELNMLKANVAREDHQYMTGHPEVRAMIVLFLRSLLKKSQYKLDVRAEAVKFFSRCRTDIEKEIELYLKERDQKVTKDFDKRVVEGSETVEPPSTPPSKAYTYSTMTEDYFSESTVLSEGYEDLDWGPMSYLVVPPMEIVEEEEPESIYVPPRLDDVSTYSGITESSSNSEDIIPTVPDVTSISTDATRDTGASSQEPSTREEKSGRSKHRRHRQKIEGAPGQIDDLYLPVMRDLSEAGSQQSGIKSQKIDPITGLIIEPRALGAKYDAPGVPKGVKIPKGHGITYTDSLTTPGALGKPFEIKGAPGALGKPFEKIKAVEGQTLIVLEKADDKLPSKIEVGVISQQHSRTSRTDMPRESDTIALLRKGSRATGKTAKGRPKEADVSRSDVKRTASKAHGKITSKASSRAPRGRPVRDTDSIRTVVVVDKEDHKLPSKIEVAVIRKDSQTADVPPRHSILVSRSRRRTTVRPDPDAVSLVVVEKEESKLASKIEVDVISLHSRASRVSRRSGKKSTTGGGDVSDLYARDAVDRDLLNADTIIHDSIESVDDLNL